MTKREYIERVARQSGIADFKNFLLKPGKQLSDSYMNELSMFDAYLAKENFPANIKKTDSKKWKLTKEIDILENSNELRFNKSDSERYLKSMGVKTGSKLFASENQLSDYKNMLRDLKDKKISGHTPATDKEIINYIDTNNLSYGKTMKNMKFVGQLDGLRALKAKELARKFERHHNLESEFSAYEESLRQKIHNILGNGNSRKGRKLFEGGTVLNQTGYMDLLYYANNSKTSLPLKEIFFYKNQPGLSRKDKKIIQLGEKFLRKVANNQYFNEINMETYTGPDITQRIDPKKSFKSI